MTDKTAWEGRGLVERLREPNGLGIHALGYHPLINPDGPEAADYITALEAERDALREALEAMVDEWVDYATINDLGDPEKKHNIKRARQALAISEKSE